MSDKQRPAASLHFSPKGDDGKVDFKQKSVLGAAWARVNKFGGIELTCFTDQGCIEIMLDGGYTARPPQEDSPELPEEK